MSRNGFSPARTPRKAAPRWAAHLRQFSRSSADAAPQDALLSGDAAHAGPFSTAAGEPPTPQTPDGGPPPFSSASTSSSSPPPPPARSRSPDTASSNSTIREHPFAKHPPPVFERTCTATVNEGFAHDEVLLNLDHFDDGVQPGQLMAIDVLPDQRPGFGTNSMRRAAAAAAAAATTGRSKEDLAAPVPNNAADSSSTNNTTGAAGGPPSAASAADGAPGSSTATPAPPELDAGRRYLFIVKDMPKELKARHPSVEIYVTKRVADAFGMKKGSTVLLTPVDASNPAIEASHVELVFKDQYLSRADMWRLAVAELAERTIYRGQMVLFMSTIKATVTHVFVEGKRVQSAFFGKNTRPIFRSESARFVLFVQMAREMWDFDPDCSGEIIFSKVVNGLLPALFQRWAARKVKHLVTIVLFARVEYDTGLTADLDLAEASAQRDSYYTGVQAAGSRRPYKDFYRVVVSEMSSGEWTRILYQLKREFNLFRRDISLHHLAYLRPDTAASASQSENEPAAAAAASSSARRPFGGQKYQHHIQAESSPAMYGNVLEAINMASTLFSHDYVDRDLMRTGISVVVITPGSGVFEVEYDALRRTTEALIGNGIGIDLICVPRVPLHYAPLFRFRHPHYLERDFAKSRSYSSNSKSNSQRGSHGLGGIGILGIGSGGGSTPRQQTTPLYGSYSSVGAGSLSPGKATESSTQRSSPYNNAAGAAAAALPPPSAADRLGDSWVYALPQWLHVSYWASEPGELLMRQGVPLPPLALEGSRAGRHLEEFAVRCRMYDLQMRGVLETNEIETTPLHADPLFPRAAFRPSSDALAGPPVERDGVLVVQNRLAANVLFDQVYGFQKFAADKLARQNSRSLWKQLQEYDATRQKLPASRRALLHAPTTAAAGSHQHHQHHHHHRRDLLEDAPPPSSGSLVSGPSTLRRQHFLGGGGGGGGDIGYASAYSSDRRPSSTASYLSSTPTLTPTPRPPSTITSSTATTPTMPKSSALLSGRGLDYKSGARDSSSTPRSVSFDKDSIASSKSSSSKGGAPKALRQISLGQRGFGIAAPKVATAEVSAETVAASRLPAPTIHLAMPAPSSSSNSSSSSSKAPAAGGPPGHQQLPPSTPRASGVFSSAAGDGGFMRSPVSTPHGGGLSSADRSGYRSELGGGGAGRVIGGSTTDLRGLRGAYSDTPTRPIVIRGGGDASSSSAASAQLAAGSFLGGAGLAGRADLPGGGREPDRDLRHSNALRADDQRVYNSKLLAEAVPEVPKALSPTAAMAPWLMMINPSKPEANKIDSATFNSRWQHVFPRPGEIRAMRWKTLCSPASVPLTTEYFPSKAQFESEYQQQPYSVAQEADEDLLPEVPQTRDDLMRELISLRLSQGFQVVIGPVVARAFGQKQMKIADIFSADQPFEDGTSIFMSIGNTIHQLSLANTSEVQVNIYQRKTDEFNGGGRSNGGGDGSGNGGVGGGGGGGGGANPNSSTLYRPAIRTLLDREYHTSAIDTAAPRAERNWNYIDSYLAGHDEQLTENLRFWRARFVLIPISTQKTAAAAAAATATAPTNPGDNEEEVRIEGIRKLGQMWQKHRVIPASERHFLQNLSTHRRKKKLDTNPLDVVYKTEDPSLVIAAELESTLPLLDGSSSTTTATTTMGGGGGGSVPRKSQLVTSREHPFRKGSLNRAALAEAMQQPVEAGGVRMQNRRWHLRLHYNCFIGSDMTSWLLDNVEDLESREEAEALGNLLMVSDRDRDREHKEKDAVEAAEKDGSQPDKGKEREREGSTGSTGSGGGGGNAAATDGGSGGGGGGTSAASSSSGPSAGGSSTAKEAKRGTEQHGIFVHVEKRHPFRDGQYFYQICSEFAKPHNSGVGGWFNTRKAPAAPLTPVSDQAPQRDGGGIGGGGDGFRQVPSRPSSVHEDVPPSGSSTPTMHAASGGGGAGDGAGGGNSSKKPRVVLSKMMKYDVDHRKRSYRPERVDLHYDRLHNPDNCYHIRIEWMNVTAKLIEDAVELWAREAFQHGLRLVEVPIAEASSISEGNPFRRPYRVRLARAPPVQRPATYFDPNSLAPQAQPGRHYYQKAILRKFGFVLDTEAASNFPPSVDVTYSWGRPSFRFTQYIHRSGIILAQINDDGDFVLLVNRLYSNRSVAASVRDLRPSDQQQQQQQAQQQAQQQQQQQQAAGLTTVEPTPLQSPMVKSALYNSPRLRPTGMEAALGQKGSATTMSGLLGLNAGMPPHPNQATAASVFFSISTVGLPPGDDPESVMDELEAFCQNAAALESFYGELLEKRTMAAAGAAGAGVGIGGSAAGAAGSTSSAAGTPTSRPIMSSSSAAAAAAARATTEVPDTNIPTLGLPPGLLNSSINSISGGLGFLGSPGQYSPGASSGGGASLRSPPPNLPQPLTPLRTTSPGFLASRLFLRRSSVDDIGRDRPAEGGQGPGQQG